MEEGNPKAQGMTYSNIAIMKGKNLLLYDSLVDLCFFRVFKSTC